jgi:CPA2 family monovalent cation:H+ antiporter-2
LGQVTVAMLLGATAVALAGRGWDAGIVVGLAISVASTVVLIRVLTDNQALETEPGHIAVGWLVVEDIFTVLVLVLLPTIAALFHGGEVTAAGVAWSFALAVLKVGVLAALVLGAGRYVLPRLLAAVARTRTRELFTLAVLAIALAVATGSAAIFGVSLALGAFLAGMVVGQSSVSHQAAADALPMRDAFAVLFFVSVGMLLSPAAVLERPGLFAALLAVVLVAKPLAALAIVWVLGYSPRAGLTVAVGLAQIGEFSFIVANLAAEHRLLGVEEQGLLVACAIVSIAINPLLFRGIVPLERWLQQRRPGMWAAINARAVARATARARAVAPSLPAPAPAAANETRAVIVGYGPVGRTAASILKDYGIRPAIVDLNVDAIGMLSAAGETAIYGDGAQRDVLRAAGIESARYLLVTVPQIETRTVVVLAARELNSDLKVFVRARYLEERAWLEEIGVTQVCYEEAEAAIGLASLLLEEVGADENRIRAERKRIRARMARAAAAPLEEAAQIAAPPP